MNQLLWLGISAIVTAAGLGFLTGKWWEKRRWRLRSAHRVPVHVPLVAGCAASDGDGDDESIIPIPDETGFWEEDMMAYDRSRTGL